MNNLINNCKIMIIEELDELWKIMIFEELE